ncbi:MULTISPECIES: signal peptidase I [unclassified Enterococcus]|uniref:signal peptidase I n=1 Tax=unclassified Enterococcus TaxID=2608891 RepID=UPI001CE1C2CF|nr:MULTISPECIES: signal peptidase I [unclassified Enterococcus]MCA5013660.1 signal peptidase I [Enterococcus sp. S23]MCA5016910.1 signal peptidase I [Enterococcus sp. S22(2020)]
MEERKKRKNVTAKSKKKKKHSNNKKPETLKRNKKHRNKKRKQLLARKKKQEKRKRLLIELLITLGISIFLLTALSIFLLAFPKIEGYSMVPTLNDQEIFIVYKPAKIKRFDLVYLKNSSGEKSIRRVIGLPGEEIQYKDDDLYVNNELKAERFLSHSQEENQEPVVSDFKLYDLFEVEAIPEKKYFVLGDNREYATDSRYYGFVDEKEIIGVVKARIFPLHAMTQF